MEDVVEHMFPVPRVPGFHCLMHLSDKTNSLDFEVPSCWFGFGFELLAIVDNWDITSYPPNRRDPNQQSGVR